jgi:hypothetical protein
MNKTATSTSVKVEQDEPQEMESRRNRPLVRCSSASPSSTGRWWAWPRRRPRCRRGGRRLSPPPISRRARQTTGTNADLVNEHGSQSVEIQHLTSRCSFEAEDMGFEPTTHCWASDFESSQELRLLPRCPAVACFFSKNRSASFAANQMLRLLSGNSFGNTRSIFEARLFFTMRGERGLDRRNQPAAGSFDGDAQSANFVSVAMGQGVFQFFQTFE